MAHPFFVSGRSADGGLIPAHSRRYGERVGRPVLGAEQLREPLGALNLDAGMIDGGLVGLRTLTGGIRRQLRNSAESARPGAN